ncbi:MAG TPA: protein kinase [Acidobacteriota bacterium]|nr:protein kinase [Acidobacteriota bacterium]
MTLTSGTKLGRYEIRSQIGEGGMGEVYLARDTPLGRDVAVKVLPSTYSGDAERLHRFEQEACAASALNHPNILSIYDVGTHNGSPYVVSELLQGQTLRQRISGTTLAQKRAIDYALLIAHGLAAAHEKGIVHRDLKPDNLFITNDGRVKILDFGLAKLTGAGNTELSQTSIPTRRVDTDPGKVMGTVGYMSPEQLKGRAVDQRTDIFSFGAILYEMLSGRRAFHGESAAETMSAILKEDPPELSDTNKTVSPALERLVSHCLEKNPEARFHSARDLAFALEAIAGPTSSPTQAVTSITKLPARAWVGEKLPWVLTGVLALVVIASLPFAILYFRRSPGQTPPVTRFFIYPPEKAYFGGSFTVSPDGRRVILRINSEGKVLLWVQALDSLTAKPLAGTEDASYPFWSPDSRFIGFFSGGKLKKIEVTGGPAQTLCDAPVARGGTWNRGGVIVFAPTASGALYRVPAGGGTPAPLTMLDASREETSHYHPSFLPDSRHFLFLANSPHQESAGIYVGTLDSRETKLLVNTDASAAYAPPGYLLFLRDRTLMAQSFDADRLELTGEPFPVAEQVDRLGQGVRYALFSVSETGVLVYRSGSSDNVQLIWFDRAGKQLGAIAPKGNYATPWLSPDEKRVAVGHVEPNARNSDIWLIELARGTPTRFTFGQRDSTTPIWSPDGSRVVFSSDRDGLMNLYQRAASGTGNDEILLKSDNHKLCNDWSLDGKLILYSAYPKGGNGDLWVLPISGQQKPFPFLQTEFNEAQGRFSPDGKWIAYASNESGTWQVYVQSFPFPGGKWQVSTNGGAQPQWRRDAKELFYISADRKLMAVDVKANGSTFDAGAPKELFELRLQTVGLPGPRNYYAVAADGRRFLVASVPEERISTPTTVVLNWTADLKK